MKSDVMGDFTQKYFLSGLFYAREKGQCIVERHTES
jgi:hypothetical protein